MREATTAARSARLQKENPQRSLNAPGLTTLKMAYRAPREGLLEETLRLPLLLLECKPRRLPVARVRGVAAFGRHCLRGRLPELLLQPKSRRLSEARVAGDTFGRHCLRGADDGLSISGETGRPRLPRVDSHCMAEETESSIDDDAA